MHCSLQKSSLTREHRFPTECGSTLLLLQRLHLARSRWHTAERKHALAKGKLHTATGQLCLRKPEFVRRSLLERTEGLRT